MDNGINDLLESSLLPVRDPPQTDVTSKRVIFTMLSGSSSFSQQQLHVSELSDLYFSGSIIHVACSLHIKIIARAVKVCENMSWQTPSLRFSMFYSK